jgi:hypothetical protein
MRMSFSFLSEVINRFTTTYTRLVLSSCSSRWLANVKHTHHGVTMLVCVRRP